MLVKEYRIPLPCTVDEYQVGQLYSVAKASLSESGGGEGIIVLVNEEINHPVYGKCQYTKKKFILTNKVPSLIKVLVPAGALILYEEAWNAYPHCVTIMKNEYMKDAFSLKTESMHINDNCQTENACKLSQSVLAQRQVEVLDIATTLIDASDYKPSEDPTKIQSEKTGRGPLTKGWRDSAKPIMTCYKCVSAEFVWWGLQSKGEALLQSLVRNIMLKFSRQLYCWMDRWVDLGIGDIRAIEAKTAMELIEKTNAPLGGGLSIPKDAIARPHSNPI